MHVPSFAPMLAVLAELYAFFVLGLLGTLRHRAPGTPKRGVPAGANFQEMIFSFRHPDCAILGEIGES